ncbi:MAG: transglutaminase domain-containing protein, partial [Chloroflexi bacterium]|nr:transglutaminase domain-containing protein [Chloroflexota bacterium]
FLFESKQGYCDYYSSAMAVMLRAVGVPARVVAGYNIGDYDPASGVYTIREANSHAWTEVFFPGYGWLEFEPTPSRPAFDRPETPEQSPEQPGDLGDIPPIESFLPDDAPIEDPGAGMGEGYVSDADYSSVLSLLQWTITLAAAGVIGFLALAYYWRRALKGLTPSQRPYAKVARIASWLGRPQRPSETPAEYVDWLGRLIPGYRQSLALLGASFTRAQFGRQALSAAELLRLNDAWHDVRVALVKALASRWIAQRLPSRPRWLQGRT